MKRTASKLDDLFTKITFSEECNRGDVREFLKGMAMKIEEALVAAVFAEERNEAKEKRNSDKLFSGRHRRTFHRPKAAPKYYTGKA